MLKRTHDTHTHSHAGSLCAAATPRRRDYGAHTHRRVHALPSETVPPVPVCLSGPSSCGHPARPSGHSSEERDKTSRRGAAVSHCCVNFPTRSSAERAPKHPWAGLPSLAPPRPASARPAPSGPLKAEGEAELKRGCGEKGSCIVARSGLARWQPRPRPGRGRASSTPGAAQPPRSWCSSATRPAADRGVEHGGGAGYAPPSSDWCGSLRPPSVSTQACGLSQPVKDLFLIRRKQGASSGGGRWGVTAEKACARLVQ